MKLYSQNGFGEVTKVIEGLQNDFIDGVIISPKDISSSKLTNKIEQYREVKKDAELLFDPQFYASIGMEADGYRLGHLLEDYNDYFTLRRRSALERESAVEGALEAALKYQMGMPFLDAIIAPNILISKSIDSAEALIAKNFIRLAPEIYKKLGGKKPLFLTLAVSREALDKDDFLEFTNEITALDRPPAGFYILLGARNTEDRSEIFNSKILAYWMYLNYSLSAVNGFKVVNGFSDLASPILAAAGATAGATGWWSNLRTFSLSRFEPAMTGGHLPTPRYLSAKLLNRITFSEFDQIRKIVPSVANRLPSDEEYPEGERGSEPYRHKEVLQTWNALKSICMDLNASVPKEALEKLMKAIREAQECYDKIQRIGIQLEPKSGSEHLEAIGESIQRFKSLAELDA
ncbi:MAG: hypothetical protein JW913_07860 [Chitinispirillaceae bacterium]|nr:hypothetical protein [Chitinispirillaceae bacterium]